MSIPPGGQAHPSPVVSHPPAQQNPHHLQQPPHHAATPPHIAVKVESSADTQLPQAVTQQQQQIAATASPAPSALHPPPPPPVVRFPLPGLSLPTDFQPILQDHHAVLYPNYQTPFASAHDAISRLLPWHVWQVPEDIIALAKGKQFVPPASSYKGKQKAIQPEAVATTDAATSLAFTNGQRPKKRKRVSARMQYGHDLVSVPRVEKAGSSSQATFERIEGLDFPTMDDLEGIIPRYQSIHSRMSQIRHLAEGGKESKPSTDKEDPEPAAALFARESHLQLLRQAHADEKADLDALLQDLKQARFNMMAQYGGIWQTELDKVAPGLPAIARDELYNPPPPPPPPRARQPPPPPLSQASPAMPAAPVSRQSPVATSSVPPTSRATSTDKNDNSRAASKSKASSPAASKSQSPVRQLSPGTSSANGAKPRKRPSVTPAPRQSTGPTTSNGAGAAQAATTPAPNTVPQTYPRPVPGQQPYPQAGAAPPPHLPLHMQHQYSQSWVPPPAAGSTAVPPRPSIPPSMQGPSLSTTATSPVAGSSSGSPVAGATSAYQRPPSMPTNGAAAGASQPPIRVVLPLNLIQTLTDAGIAPQPAPHLKPAIEAHKRRAAQAWAQGNAAPPLVSRGDETDSPTGGYSTAPVDPDPNQKFAAVLLGITEAVVPGGGNQGERYQLVHLSLKLDKLEPNQLHALATAVNMVQGQQAPATAGTSGHTGAAAGGPLMGMQQQQQQQSANGQGSQPGLAANQSAQGPPRPQQQQQQQQQGPPPSAPSTQQQQHQPPAPQQQQQPQQQP